MKSKLIFLSRDILTVILNHFLFVTAPITIFSIFQLKDVYMAAYISLIIIPLYFLFLRYTVRNTILLILLHLPAVFIALNVSKSGVAIVFAVMITVCYIIMSVFAVFKLKRRQDLLFPPIMIVALIFAFSIIEYLIGKRILGDIYPIFVLIYIPIYLIYSYINSYIGFVEINELSASNLPKSRIFNFGFRQNILFTLFSAVILVVVSTFDFLAKFITSAGEKSFFILRKLLGLINIKSLKPVDGGTGFENSEPPKMIGRKIDSWIFDLIGIFLNVMGVILAIALFTVLIKGIGAVFKNSELKKPHKIIFKDDIDVYETCDIESIKKERSKRSIFTDKRGKIRKAYKKKVLKNKGELIGSDDKLKLQYLTAKECCEKLGEPVLKELYEKAKYSGKEITSEDLKLL